MAALASSCGKGEDGKEGAQGPQGERGPEGPANTFVVTFVYPDGTQSTQTVLSGGWATQPIVYPRQVNALYAGTVTKTGWCVGDTAERFNFDTPITANTTIRWEPSTLPINLDSVAGTTLLDKAFAYVNANPAAYTFFVVDSINLAGSTTRVLSASNAKLTIFSPYVGAAQPSISVSSSAKGRLFAVGAENVQDNSVSLTIHNVCLSEPQSGNDDSLVYVQNGAAFSLSGEGQVWGELVLQATGPNNRTALTLGADWTKRGDNNAVKKLSLRGTHTDVDTVIGYWANKPIVIGAGVNAANIGEITLGDFLTTGVDTEAISTSYKINEAGVLVLK